MPPESCQGLKMPCSVDYCRDVKKSDLAPALSLLLPYTRSAHYHLLRLEGQTEHLPQIGQLCIFGMGLGCRLGSSDFDKLFENCYASCSFGLSKDIILF